MPLQHLAYIGPGVGPSSGEEPWGLWLLLALGVTLLAAAVHRRCSSSHPRWGTSILAAVRGGLGLAVLSGYLLLFSLPFLLLGATPTAVAWWGGSRVVTLAWTRIWMGFPRGLGVLALGSGRTVPCLAAGISRGIGATGARAVQSPGAGGGLGRF